VGCDPSFRVFCGIFATPSQQSTGLSLRSYTSLQLYTHIENDDACVLAHACNERVEIRRNISHIHSICILQYIYTHTRASSSSLACFMPSAMLNLLHRFVRSRPNQMARHLPVPLEHSCIAPGPRFFAQICPPAMLNRFFSDEAEISRAIRCGPKLCTRKRWAIGSIATGSVLFALGMFALLYIPIALRDGVNSNMSVSSADSPL
jgi:hypothetical protein